MTATPANADLHARLRRIRHIALDMDGTIYRDGQLFESTLPFLSQLEEQGIGYSFLTNNTSLSRDDYVTKLNRLGIPASLESIQTPAQATMAVLRERFPDVRSLAVLGTPSLSEEFERGGWSISWETPQAVVVGFDTTLTYERLCRAAYWIQKGLPFLATHPDLVCPTSQETVLVDCGSICACLTAATGRSPIVLGKPEPTMLEVLCLRYQLQPDELAMVGDRIYTDLAMAKRANAFSVLVLSGEATAEETAQLADPPDLVVPEIGELGRWLTQSRR
jgi:Predicted sugar phosphatases of the HAD superfamily